MVELLALLLFFGLVLALTLAFQSLLARHIASDTGRIIAVGLFFVVALVGGAYGMLTLALSAIFYSPTTTHPINDTYYFTQQEYGFVTMMSSGYDLTFYQQRPFWFDKELGKVQLECSGKESVEANLEPRTADEARLRVRADHVTRLDTVLSISAPFNFRRTFEDRTLNFSKAP